VPYFEKAVAAYAFHYRVDTNPEVEHAKWMLNVAKQQSGKASGGDSSLSSLSPSGRLFAANHLAATEGSVRVQAARQGLDWGTAFQDAMNGLGYSASGGTATRIDGLHR
jgi:hypothetical protein